MSRMPTAIAEQEYVRRAAGGDAEAFESLYRAHIGRVYGLCLRMCGDPRQAEELAQDAFVRAWQKLDGFQGRSAFGTWMYRLTANVVLQHFRTTRRRSGREFSLEEAPGLEHPETGRAAPGERLDLDRAVTQLPEGARIVFVLHDVEGYKHAEIAEMTGSAVGTCKAQLHRARRLLREMLA